MTQDEVIECGNKLLEEFNGGHYHKDDIYNTLAGYATVGWISVKDRLPEDFEEVLAIIVTSDNPNERQIVIASYGVHYKKTRCWKVAENPTQEYPANYWEGTFEAILWMPLPKPPSDEQ